MGMASGHTVLCLPGPVALKVGTALGGMSFGAVFPLLVITVSEIFGQKRPASNYMIFDGSPGAVGSIIFAKLIAGTVYKSHQECDSAGDCTCSGDECFRLSHIVIVGMELAVTVVAAFLAMRSQGVYRVLRGEVQTSSQDA